MKRPATFLPRTGIVRCALAATLWLAAAAGPLAHEGHDHGDTPAAAGAPASGPRFVAASDVFELVGALDGRRLTLWLDRAVDNAPVPGATIELELGGRATKARAEGDAYVVELPEPHGPGRLPIVATVLAGGTSDLLAAELVVAPPTAVAMPAAASVPSTAAVPWTTVAIAAAAAFVAGLAGWLAGRRRTVSCLVAGIAIAIGLLPRPVPAHEGHDHGDASPPPARSGAPQRQPDGSLWLPKASQRLVGVRTVVAERSEQARAIELPGIVAADPDAGGRVQSTLAGRLEPGPRGLPVVGQSVARGQLLATVRPSIDPVARSNQAALVAELTAAKALAQARVERLRGLSDTVPRREIEAADSELASLEGRLSALSGGLAAAEPLHAPVGGVIARADALAGQVVDAREVLFEIVDSTRLRIEVAAFDAAIAPEVTGATVAIGVDTVPLAFVGAGRVLRDQTVPLVFRARHPALARLAIGARLAVTVRLRSAEAGVALPAAAVVRNAANEPIVWVKTEPERFEPRRVRTQPLDAARVRVVAGLAGGERVVTEGAPLLGQFR